MLFAGVDDIVSVDTVEEAEKGMTKLTQKIKSLEQELKELKSEADKAEKQKQSLVDECRVALVSIIFRMCPSQNMQFELCQ